jgi:hypothetical protein
MSSKPVIHMRTFSLLCGALVTALPVGAAESCVTIHGRAHQYSDGQLRIWHIGTHHDYEPDESSWLIVQQWIEAGVKDSVKRTSATPDSSINLFADFRMCPVEPFKKGSVQPAKIKSAYHRHYVAAY